MIWVFFMAHMRSEWEAYVPRKGTNLEEEFWCFFLEANPGICAMVRVGLYKHIGWSYPLTRELEWSI